MSSAIINKNPLKVNLTNTEKTSNILRSESSKEFVAFMTGPRALFFEKAIDQKVVNLQGLVIDKWKNYKLKGLNSDTISFFFDELFEPFDVFIDDHWIRISIGEALGEFLEAIASQNRIEVSYVHLVGGYVYHLVFAIEPSYILNILKEMGLAPYFSPELIWQCLIVPPDKDIKSRIKDPKLSNEQQCFTKKEFEEAFEVFINVFAAHFATNIELRQHLKENVNKKIQEQGFEHSFLDIGVSRFKYFNPIGTKYQISLPNMLLNECIFTLDLYYISLTELISKGKNSELFLSSHYPKKLPELQGLMDHCSGLIRPIHIEKADYKWWLRFISWIVKGMCSGFIGLEDKLFTLINKAVISHPEKGFDSLIKEFKKHLWDHHPNDAMSTFCYLYDNARFFHKHVNAEFINKTFQEFQTLPQAENSLNSLPPLDLILTMKNQIITKGHKLFFEMAKLLTNTSAQVPFEVLNPLLTLILFYLKSRDIISADYSIHIEHHEFTYPTFKWNVYGEKTIVSLEFLATPLSAISELLELKQQNFPLWKVIELSLFTFLFEMCPPTIRKKELSSEFTQKLDAMKIEEDKVYTALKAFKESDSLLLNYLFYLLTPDNSLLDLPLIQNFFIKNNSCVAIGDLKLDLIDLLMTYSYEEAFLLWQTLLDLKTEKFLSFSLKMVEATAIQNPAIAEKILSQLTIKKATLGGSLKELNQLAAIALNIKRIIEPKNEKTINFANLILRIVRIISDIVLVSKEDFDTKSKEWIFISQSYLWMVFQLALLEGITEIRSIVRNGKKCNLLTVSSLISIFKKLNQVSTDLAFSFWRDILCDYANIDSYYSEFIVLTKVFAEKKDPRLFQCIPYIDKGKHLEEYKDNIDTIHYCLYQMSIASDELYKIIAKRKQGEFFFYSQDYTVKLDQFIIETCIERSSFEYAMGLLDQLNSKDSKLYSELFEKIAAKVIDTEIFLLRILDLFILYNEKKYLTSTTFLNYIFNFLRKIEKHSTILDVKLIMQFYDFFISEEILHNQQLLETAHSMLTGPLKKKMQSKQIEKMTNKLLPCLNPEVNSDKTLEIVQLIVKENLTLECSLNNALTWLKIINHLFEKKHHDQKLIHAMIQLTEKFKFIPKLLSNEKDNNEEKALNRDSDVFVATVANKIFSFLMLDSQAISEIFSLFKELRKLQLNKEEEVIFYEQLLKVSKFFQINKKLDEAIKVLEYIHHNSTLNKDGLDHLLSCLEIALRNQQIQLLTQTLIKKEMFKEITQKKFKELIVSLKNHLFENDKSLKNFQKILFEILKVYFIHFETESEDFWLDLLQRMKKISSETIGDFVQFLESKKVFNEAQKKEAAWMIAIEAIFCCNPKEFLSFIDNKDFFSEHFTKNSENYFEVYFLFFRGCFFAAAQETSPTKKLNLLTSINNFFIQFEAEHHFEPVFLEKPIPEELVFKGNLSDNTEKKYDTVIDEKIYFQCFTRFVDAPDFVKKLANGEIHVLIQEDRKLSLIACMEIDLITVLIQEPYFDSIVDQRLNVLASKFLPVNVWRNIGDLLNAMAEMKFERLKHDFFNLLKLTESIVIPNLDVIKVVNYILDIKKNGQQLVSGLFPDLRTNIFKSFKITFHSVNFYFKIFYLIRGALSTQNFISNSKSWPFLKNFLENLIEACQLEDSKYEIHLFAITGLIEEKFDEFNEKFSTFNPEFYVIKLKTWQKAIKQDNLNDLIILIKLTIESIKNYKKYRESLFNEAFKLIAPIGMIDNKVFKYLSNEILQLSKIDRDPQILTRNECFNFRLMYLNLVISQAKVHPECYIEFIFLKVQEFVIDFSEKKDDLLVLLCTFRDLAEYLKESTYIQKSMELMYQAKLDRHLIGRESKLPKETHANQLFDQIRMLVVKMDISQPQQAKIQPSVKYTVIKKVDGKFRLGKEFFGDDLLEFQKLEKAEVANNYPSSTKPHQNGTEKTIKEEVVPAAILIKKYDSFWKTPDSPAEKRLYYAYLIPAIDGLLALFSESPRGKTLQDKIAILSAYIDPLLTQQAETDLCLEIQEAISFLLNLQRQDFTLLELQTFLGHLYTIQHSETYQWQLAGYKKSKNSTDAFKKYPLVSITLTIAQGLTTKNSFYNFEKQLITNTKNYRPWNSKTSITIQTHQDFQSKAFISPQKEIKTQGVYPLPEVIRVNRFQNRDIKYLELNLLEEKCWKNPLYQSQIKLFLDHCETTGSYFLCFNYGFKEKSSSQKDELLKLTSPNLLYVDLTEINTFEKIGITEAEIKNVGDQVKMHIFNGNEPKNSEKIIFNILAGIFLQDLISTKYNIQFIAPMNEAASELDQVIHALSFYAGMIRSDRMYDQTQVEQLRTMIHAKSLMSGKEMSLDSQSLLIKGIALLTNANENSNVLKAIEMNVCPGLPFKTGLLQESSQQTFYLLPSETTDHIEYELSLAKEPKSLSFTFTDYISDFLAESTVDLIEQYMKDILRQVNFINGQKVQLQAVKKNPFEEYGRKWLKKTLLNRKLPEHEVDQLINDFYKLVSNYPKEFLALYLQETTPPSLSELIQQIKNPLIKHQELIFCFNANPFLFPNLNYSSINECLQDLFGLDAKEANNILSLEENSLGFPEFETGLRKLIQDTELKAKIPDATRFSELIKIIKLYHRYAHYNSIERIVNGSKELSIHYVLQIANQAAASDPAYLLKERYDNLSCQFAYRQRDTKKNTSSNTLIDIVEETNGTIFIKIINLSEIINMETMTAENLKSTVTINLNTRDAITTWNKPSKEVQSLI